MRTIVFVRSRSARLDRGLEAPSRCVLLLPPCACHWRVCDVRVVKLYIEVNTVCFAVSAQGRRMAKQTEKVQ